MTERTQLRSRLGAGLSLAAVACALAWAGPAEAGSWTCATIDTGVSPVAVTALESDGLALAYYTTTENANPFPYFWIKGATNLTSPWTTYYLDGWELNSEENAYYPGVTLWNGSVWAAYYNRSWELIVTSIADGGFGAATYWGVDVDDYYPEDAGPPSVIAYNGTLHIFYPHNGTWAPLQDAMFNGTSWEPSTLIDTEPYTDDYGAASVAFNGALHVFWTNAQTGQLLHRAASTGTDWGPLHHVDGAGSSGPHTTDSVGGYLSVIVDGDSPPNMHVFYEDTTTGAVLEAWSATGGDADWHYDQVDGSAMTDFQGASSVLVNGGTTLELYYVDTVNYTLREAQKTSLTGSTWNLSTVDGQGGKCANGTGTSDRMVGGTAALSPGGNPQVFYFDADATTLRVATYQ